MAIRFILDGNEYVCDTPLEAAKLTRLLGGSRKRRRRSETPQVSAGHRPIQQELTPGTPARSEHAAHVLQALLDAPNGLGSDALARKIGLGPKSLPPIIGHLSSMLKGLDYDVKSILERRTVYDRGRGKSIYVLTNLGKEIVPRLLQPAA